jgi:sorting and assembly machinery component 37
VEGTYLASRLTTLDIILAAHVLLIIKPPFPDTLLSDLLTDSYPTLVSHAERILSRSLEFPAPMYSSPKGHSIWSLVPSLPVPRRKSEEDTHYERMTWGWVGLAVGSVGLYLLAIGNPLEFRWSEREVEESK